MIQSIIIISWLFLEEKASATLHAPQTIVKYLDHLFPSSRLEKQNYYLMAGNDFNDPQISVK